MFHRRPAPPAEHEQAHALRNTFAQRGGEIESRTGSAENSRHLDELDGGLGGIHCERTALSIGSEDCCAGGEAVSWVFFVVVAVSEKSGLLFCAIRQGFSHRPLRLV